MSRVLRRWLNWSLGRPFGVSRFRDLGFRAIIAERFAIRLNDVQRFIECRFNRDDRGVTSGVSAFVLDFVSGHEFEPRLVAFIPVVRGFDVVESPDAVHLVDGRGLFE